MKKTSKWAEASLKTEAFQGFENGGYFKIMCPNAETFIKNRLGQVAKIF